MPIIVGQKINTVEYLSADGNTYEIILDLTEVTNIPEGAILEVKELSGKDSEDYIEKAANAIDTKVDSISYAKLFDISIVYNNEKLQPDGPVKVEVTLQDKEKDIHPQVVHFGKKTEVLNASEDGNTVEFSTNSFSVFAVLGTEIIIAPNGEFKFENDRYAVTVSYTEEAKIPLGTELTVTEITPEDDLYWDLWKQTVDKINEGVKWENPDLPDPRKGLTDAAFFDITLKYEGNKIEPAVPLGVKIEYKNGGILTPENENTLVVHFAEEGTELIEDVQTEKAKVDTSMFPGVLKNSDAVESFTYTQGSFSIVGTGSTGDYVEINDGNIDGQPMELRAPKLAAGRASSISAGKTVTDSDGDGVYELALSVTGASESSSSTKVDKSNSADNNYYPFSSSCGELCKVYTTKSYKCETDTNGQCIVDSNGEIIYDDLNGNIFSTDTHYTNRNDLCNLLDSTKLSKNNMYYCNQFVNASHITNIYLINYYDTKSFKDYVKSNPKDSAGNLIFSNRSFRSYVSYMPRHNHADSKKDKLLLIVEQEHEATTEFGDKYYTYASIEVNRYGK